MSIVPATTSILQELTFLMDYMNSSFILRSQINENIKSLVPMLLEAEQSPDQIYAQGFHDGILAIANSMDQIYDRCVSTYGLTNEAGSESQTDDEKTNDNN
jgi:hypothetical protein